MTAKLFPVLHSQLAPISLVNLINNNYDIGNITDCRLITSQMNDTYLVNTCSSDYVLRVYRADRKPLQEICNEVEILSFLDERGVGVSSAIRNQNGEYLLTLSAPEGDRYAVLFRFIDGDTPNSLRINYFSFGKALAEIHRASDEFNSSNYITELNLEYLLDQSIGHLAGNLKIGQEDLSYLRNLSEKLKLIIESTPAEFVDHGFCHGDSQPDNARVDKSGKITFLDFDNCGWGYRIYDLATFFYIIFVNIPFAMSSVFGLFVRRRINTWFEKFLAGYKSIRELKRGDLSLLPAFIAARHIWTIGLRAQHVNLWGLKYMNEDILKDSIKFLKGFEKIYLSPFKNYGLYELWSL